MTSAARPCLLSSYWQSILRMRGGSGLALGDLRASMESWGPFAASQMTEVCVEPFWSLLPVCAPVAPMPGLCDSAAQVLGHASIQCHSLRSSLFWRQ